LIFERRRAYSPGARISGRSVVKKPCAANLVTARDLVEHGVVGEGAEVLVDLRRCAADCGCEDWQNCDEAVQDAWHEATHNPLPEARPKPARRERD
jgi:hypothetical protein